MFLFLLLVPLGLGCAGEVPKAEYDVVIRGGSVYDGSGSTPRRVDVGIVGATIVAVGDLSGASARAEIDATGMAVAPGFINVLSWATDSLIEDPRSLADIRQGVTLEVFGEGWSMGPLNEAMRTEAQEDQADIEYTVDWTSLEDYLERLVSAGVSPNVASFVGATTVRIHELGYEDRPPTAEELERMKGLVEQAMQDGALGLGTSLIYAPAFYAETDELIALSRVAAEYGGRYITHMRSEGDRLLEAVDEVLKIAREAGIGAEIYHLKAAGEENWAKMDAVIQRVEEARVEGLDITADMYTYPAGATGLDAAMPPWVQEGGYDAWAERLRDPEIRARVVGEMGRPGADWENLLYAAGSADRVILIGFKSEALKPLTGRTLASVAEERGVTPEDAAIDLVIEDDSRVGTVYFLMLEENLEKQIRLPWVSFGSDAGSPAPEGVFLRSNPHPRAYGNFARLLGHYVRDREVIPLQEAIRRLTSLPAENLKLQRRGRIAPEYFADLVVFNPATVQDLATFDDPHQLAVGVRDVLVNGQAVLRDGEHTGATPGRIVRGPGWTGWIQAEREGAGGAADAARDEPKPANGGGS
ncbi:MAG: D-aminoacylase [Thermoanaerobaculia bacterium]|nr:D-aminoacylase [Thermoanaerobaculia bacterium]